MLESRTAWHMGLSGVTAVAMAVACGSLSADKSASGGDINGPSQNGSGAETGGEFFGGSGGFGPGGDAAAVALPPEQETKVNFELPAAGQHFVYVANPDSNTVSVIDAKSLAIQTVQAGAQPTFLQSLGGADAAIVLNVGSFDATIVRTNNGTSTTSTVGVQRGSNAIAVAPDGLHAVVYYDETFATGTGTPGSFQDVSVVSLAEGNDRSTGMTVGFRPSSVFFSSDGKKAFVVTEDGVSILDFAAVEKSGSGIATTVSLGGTGTDQTLDVSVTSDGRYALARSDTSSALRLVDLGSGKIMSLDLATIVASAAPPDAGVGTAPPADGGTASDGGTDAGTPAPTVTPPPTVPTGPITVTDVDLAPSGTYAMAVVRELSAAVRLPIPDAFTDGSKATVTTVTGETVGSVTLSPGGKYALLYTTASDTIERLTVLGLNAGATPRSYQLRKPIASVAIAPDDGTALIVHKKLAGDPNQAGIDADTKLSREDAYSVVRLDTGFAKLQVTGAPLGPSAIVPDSSELFILFDAPGLFEVQQVDLRSFLVQAIELGSPPVSVGAVPSSNRVFVGQDHPDGRISFIDWTTGAVQSVTGFELNSRIVE